MILCSGPMVSGCEAGERLGEMGEGSGISRDHSNRWLMSQEL